MIKVTTINEEQINLFLKYFSNKNYWAVLPDNLKSDVYKLFVNNVKVSNGNIVSIELASILQ